MDLLFATCTAFKISRPCSNINSEATVTLQTQLASYTHQVDHEQYILLQVTLYFMFEQIEVTTMFIDIEFLNIKVKLLLQLL